MPISLLPQIFIISLLSAIIWTTNFSHAYKQCMHDQKTLLLDLRNEVKFNPSYSWKMVSWNQSDNCCTWIGVECNDAGQVISLQLNLEGIYGGLESSSSLFRLRYLEKLNLALNDFNGAPIPRGIGNLTYLTHLDLSHANFGGQIPMEISLLMRLVSLDLSRFSDDVGRLKLAYPDLGMVLRKNLTGLEELNLDHVDISGGKSEWYDIISSSLPSLRNLSLRHCSLSNPSDPSLSRFRSLVLLRLDGNNLSTVVPNFFVNFSNLAFLSLYNCSLKGFLDLSNNFFFGSNLVSLDLSWNRLEGPIPESFFRLESIEVLILSYNLFNGTFRLETIQRLCNLSELDLSHNKNLSVDVRNTNSSIYPPLQRLRLASCNLYYFPDFIKQSSTLQHLDLSNNWIAGEIPSWIWQIGNGTLSWLNLSCNLLVDLQKPYKIVNFTTFLDLHSKNLQGEFPLPPQRALFVDYSNNNFNNTIPPNIGNFTFSLYTFSLKNNSISGSIPPSLCNSVFLQVLDLSLNKLTGNIPPCLLDKMESLQVLNLGRNNISGEIPDKFSVNCSLITLELNDNSLAGDILLSLARCKSLVVMNVGNNKINDTFPCMLPSSLRILVLRFNRFYGEMGCHKSFPNLQIIDIASNNFSGNLYSQNFSSWRGMMAVNAQSRHIHLDFDNLHSTYYQDEVTLTVKGLEMKLVKIWPDFTCIDFSCNSFKGEIGEAIGDLTSLYLLNLSHNAFSGTIPKSLGKLTELGSLDLSENELTGVIPMELAKLTFLSMLNVSYNKLVGEIPIGPQLQTFSSDSKPSNIRCMNTEVASVELEEKMEIEWEYVSIVFGYVLGLGSFVWVLFGCMSMRDMYFEKVDEILENILVAHNRRRRRHERRSVPRRRQCC